MTEAEFIVDFKERYGESGTFTWTDTAATGEIVKLLKSAVRRITSRYETYHLLQAVVVAQKQNMYDLADIQPDMLTGDEKILRLANVQYQRGTGGSAACTNSGGAAVSYAATAHGLAAGDYVEIFNTKHTNGYNGVHAVLAAPNADNFTITQTYVADDTAVWVDNSTYERRWLDELPIERVQAMPYNVIRPTENRPQAGTAILDWIVQADKVPIAGDLPQYILPEGEQHYIVDLAVALGFAAEGDERLARHMMVTGLVNLNGLIVIPELEKIRADQNPSQPVIIGGWKGRNGFYGFKHRTFNALTIFPVTT